MFIVSAIANLVSRFSAESKKPKEQYNPIPWEEMTQEERNALVELTSLSLM